MLTDRQRALVRESWALVAPIAPRTGSLFAARLFELDPALRPVFAHMSDAERNRKLLFVLALIVSSLDGLDAVGPSMQALRRRHAAYGARDAQYDTVGAAFLWALDQALGPALTPEAHEAWAAAYAALAGAMRPGGGETTRAA
jgi:hemoglobin-like flavoprotein